MEVASPLLRMFQQVKSQDRAAEKPLSPKVTRQVAEPQGSSIRLFVPIQRRRRLLPRLYHQHEGVKAVSGRLQQSNNYRNKPTLMPCALTINYRVKPGEVRLLNNRWSDLKTEEINLPSVKNPLLFHTGIQLQTGREAIEWGLFPRFQKNSKRRT